MNAAPVAEVLEDQAVCAAVSQRAGVEQRRFDHIHQRAGKEGRAGQRAEVHHAEDRAGGEAGGEGGPGQHAPVILHAACPT